jgi:hypothetical protein
MQAEAARQHATTEASKVYWDTIGAGGSAELAKKKSEEAYNYAHANYMNNRASLDRQSAKFGQSQTFFNKNTNQTELYTPVRAKDGTTSWQKEILPEGVEPYKQRQEMTDLQKDRMKRLDVLDEEGHFNDKSSGKVNQALRNQWIQQNHLAGLVGDSGDDPIAAAANKAGPPKPGGNAAPAPVSSPEELKRISDAAAARRSRNAAVPAPASMVAERIRRQQEADEQARKDRAARNAAVPG